MGPFHARLFRSTGEEEARAWVALTDTWADALNRDVDVATPNSLHPSLKDRILSELVPLL